VSLRRSGRQSRRDCDQQPFNLTKADGPKMQDDGVKRTSFNRARAFLLALRFGYGAASQADRENWTLNFLFLQARAKNARSSSEICQSKEIRAIPTNLAKRHRRRRAPRSSRQSRAALLMFILPCGQIIICGPNIHSSTNRYTAAASRRLARRREAVLQSSQTRVAFSPSCNSAARCSGPRAVYGQHGAFPLPSANKR
jgi:hypothetical protein